MAADLTKSPYYDDFDPEKEFLQVLAVPGRALQAREFTQAQSILRHSIKRLSETLMRDGNIVTGMDFRVDENNVLTVEEGLVYIQGMIHKFSEQSIQLSGEGEELVGVVLEETIITSTDDKSLRDQAPGFVNYENPGADRLKGVVKLTLDDESSPVVYRFVNGEIVKTTTTVQRDVMNDTLAKRTYDESGNYRVNGFELYTDEGTEDDIILTIDPGKAYVLGYEVSKVTPTRVSLEKSRETRTINNESKFYRSNTYRYPINNNPVQKINRVNGEVRITREQVVRGTQIGGTDYLAKTSVAIVDRVWQENADGSVVKEFVEGEDYQLINAQGISWQPLGEEPSIGQSYYVTYRYNKVMIENTDYRLVFEGQNENRQYYIEFLTGSNDRPVADSQFYVDYNFFLARKDLVTLNQDGDITVIKGQSEIPRLVTTPTNNDPSTLRLGTVFISADSGSSIPNSFSVTRLDMSDLQGLVRRINDIEYNQAVTALDKEALETEQASELRGVFSDGFYNTSKADLYHSDFGVAFSLEDGQIRLPTVSTTVAQPDLQGNSKVKKWGRVVSSPMKEEVAIKQLQSTGGISMNPYAMFNMQATLQLKPKSDNWVQEEKIIIEGASTKTPTIHRWWMHAGMEWNDTEKFLFESLSGGKSKSGKGKIERSSAISILNQSVQFMRERTINFTARNLTRGGNNLELYFDGQRVDITPTTGFRSGDIPGSIRANMSGLAMGKFTIPGGVRVGTRPVVLKNDNNYAETSFTAQGRNRNPEKVIFPEQPAVKGTHPLAQSFVFDRDKILTSVSVYFSSVPSTAQIGGDETKADVVFQIRNMENGFPGNIVYAEKTHKRGDMVPDYHAREEFKVTFDDPVMCKSNTPYCLTILGGHPGFALFYSELGAFKTETQGHSQLPSDRVLVQPYIEGTLFTSSNAITWTPHQTRDLKMKIFTATFEEEGLIEFDPIRNLEADRVMMLSEYLTPVNTGCDWEIRILHKDAQGTLDNMEWEPISNYDDIDLSQVAKELQLRATFKADRYMSPMIALDGVSLVGFMTGLEGSYVGRNVVFPAGSEYTTVTQTFDGHIPNGCTIKPYYSVDGGATWIENDATPVIEPVDDLFNRYTYTTQAPSGAHRSFKVKLTIKALNAIARPRAARFINIAK